MGRKKDTGHTSLNESKRVSTEVIESLKRSIAKGFIQETIEYVKNLSDSSKDNGRQVIEGLKTAFIDYFVEKTVGLDVKSRYTQNKYFDDYLLATSLYECKDREEINQEVSKSLLKSTTIYPVVLSLAKGCDLFSVEEACACVSHLISNWTYDEMEFFIENPVVIKEGEGISELIIDKILEWMVPKKVPELYSIEDDGHLGYVVENCSFIIKFKTFCVESGLVGKWVSFIQTRSNNDLIILNKHGVFDSLTVPEVEMLVEKIELDCVVRGKLQWYSRQKLVFAENIVKCCRENGCNIFEIVSKRLISIDLSNKNNIYLAVLLVEMLSLDKPDVIGSSYNERKDWETKFNRHLVELKQNYSQNKTLSVLLWAVYFQTASSLDALSQIFGYLPPYIQIRCVRKFFHLISQGKVNYTAEKLYDVLNKGEKSICLPLEIVFEYLKLRENNPNATMTQAIMLRLLEGRKDHAEWYGIKYMLLGCPGRYFINEEITNDDSYFSEYYNGLMKDTSEGVVFLVPRKMIDGDVIDGDSDLTIYNNKYFQSIQELIRISFSPDDYKVVENNERWVYYLFKEEKKIELFALARPFRFNYGFEKSDCIDVISDLRKEFCEGRLSNSLDNIYKIAFNWCDNAPCFRPPLRFFATSEWEYYTVLDFMRILGIPTDYENKEGKITKHGQYIIFASYLRSFGDFYEHLKCRVCGELMRPECMSNFAYRAVTQFSCYDENCQGYGKTVYLNHCFNSKCNSIIDSRDSKTCPNGQYICPECGACCSTENARGRLDNLKQTGGVISRRLVDFVRGELGHWEKGVFFCYNCGKQIEDKHCKECDIFYAS